VLALHYTEKHYVESGTVDYLAVRVSMYKIFEDKEKDLCIPSVVECVRFVCYDLLKGQKGNFHVTKPFV
jgi:uncharacterized Fe-S cluster-containing protein